MAEFLGIYDRVKSGNTLFVFEVGQSFIISVSSSVIASEVRQSTTRGIHHSQDKSLIIKIISLDGYSFHCQIFNKIKEKSIQTV
jgi:hypothetical protein